MFQLLFERSSDPIWLLDPEAGVFVDCNEAAVDLMGYQDKGDLLRRRPDELSPRRQPDGRLSAEAAAEIAKRVQLEGRLRFEWCVQRADGTDLPVEVVATQIPCNGRALQVVVSRDITQRKRAEEQIRQWNRMLEQRVSEATAELRAREAQFRTLVEHAPEAIVVLDGNTGRFVAVNENTVRLFGRSREQLLELTPAEVSPPFQPSGRLSTEAAREHMHSALEGNTPVFEWVHRHLSGRLFTSEVRLVRLPDERCCLLRASIIDNTERKRQEQVQRATYEISEAVHTAEDLWRLYERIHHIVGTLMPAKNFYLALLDPATEMISFPYFVDESEPTPRPFRLGTGLTSYVLRTGRPLLVGPELNARKVRVGNEVTFEGLPDLRYTETGTPAAIWLGVPLTVGGKPFGVMSVQDYRDPDAYGEDERRLFTFVATQTALAIERKKAEAERFESAARLRETEARFSAAFHASPVLSTIARMDDGKFVEANEAFLIWAGLRREEFIGRNSHDLNLWVDPAKRASFWAEVQERGQVRHRECEVRTQRGLIHTVLLSADVIQINQQPHVLTVALDISERKRAEVEMWRALEQERKLNQLKSNFVSMVSHEFRTPLGIIHSSAEILGDYFDQLETPERGEHLKSITLNTARMAAIMEEVLVLGRLDAGKMDFQPSLLDLRSFCERLIQDVLSATERQNEIEVFVARDIPGEVLADERLLRHIFLNLLTNAVKYSEKGQPVEFRLDRVDRDLVCLIRDRGIGIPEADRQWLFHAFHRGSNVGNRHGTGLGLVIVKRCAELHGGKLEMISNVGEGTSVTVRLPVFAGAAVEPPAAVGASQ